jgi:hypothetical protein
MCGKVQFEDRNISNDCLIINTVQLKTLFFMATIKNKDMFAFHLKAEIMIL